MQPFAVLAVFSIQVLPCSRSRLGYMHVTSIVIQMTTHARLIVLRNDSDHQQEARLAYATCSTRKTGKAHDLGGSMTLRQPATDARSFGRVQLRSSPRHDVDLHGSHPVCSQLERATRSIMQQSFFSSNI